MEIFNVVVRVDRVLRDRVASYPIERVRHAGIARENRRRRRRRSASSTIPASAPFAASGEDEDGAEHR